MQQSAEAELILLCECTKVHVYVGGFGECRIEVVIVVFGSYWIWIILIACFLMIYLKVLFQLVVFGRIQKNIRK